MTAPTTAPTVWGQYIDYRNTQISRSGKWSEAENYLREIVRDEDPKETFDREFYNTPSSAPVKVPVKVKVPKLVKEEIKITDSPVSEEVATKAAEKLGYKLALKALATSKFEKILWDLNISPFNQKVVAKYKEAILAIERQAEGSSWTFCWTSTLLSGYSEEVPSNVLDLCVKIQDKASEANIGVEFFVEYLTKRNADPFMKAVVSGKEYYFGVWNEPTFDALKATLATD